MRDLIFKILNDKISNLELELKNERLLIKKDDFGNLYLGNVRTLGSKCKVLKNLKNYLETHNSDTHDSIYEFEVFLNNGYIKTIRRRLTDDSNEMLSALEIIKSVKEDIQKIYER